MIASAAGAYHRLTSDGPTYDFQGLRESVSSTLKNGERTLTVDIDAIGYLDPAVIRELVLGLRRLREVGGTLRLQTTRPGIAKALCSIGLDKVFRVATATT
ncbi:MAG: STAS domain-containing protein [Candidatus Eremiobacteraeota bacterium]|nr:STAS domain-containing protein [Candidatus Eremiobacteraeota bacterium]